MSASGLAVVPVLVSWLLVGSIACMVTLTRQYWLIVMLTEIVASLVPLPKVFTVTYSRAGNVMLFRASTAVAKLLVLTQTTLEENVFSDDAA